MTKSCLKFESKEEHHLARLRRSGLRERHHVSSLRPQPIPTTIHKLSTGLSKQSAVVAQDHLCGVVAGGAGDAAAGMGAGPAMVESLQRAAVIGVSEHRPRREQLVQRQRAVENIAAEKAELALQIERGKNLSPDHAVCKARRVDRKS